MHGVTVLTLPINQFATTVHPITSKIGINCSEGYLACTEKRLQSKFCLAFELGFSSTVAIGNWKNVVAYTTDAIFIHFFSLFM